MLVMIVSFKDKGTEDVFDGNDSKDARKTCPINLWNVAQRKLDQLNAAISLDDMKVPPGNRLEALKAERKGQYSIRINDQYRICFVWTPEGACEIEIVDYHD
jgi:toxin HigB-1